MRARRYSNLIFNHLTWATLPLLLFFGGALPAFIDLDYSLSSTAALPRQRRARASSRSRC